jgi:hypothetical protein
VKSTRMFTQWGPILTLTTIHFGLLNIDWLVISMTRMQRKMHLMRKASSKRVTLLVTSETCTSSKAGQNAIVSYPCDVLGFSP